MRWSWNQGLVCRNQETSLRFLVGSGPTAYQDHAAHGLVPAHWRQRQSGLGNSRLPAPRPKQQASHAGHRGTFGNGELEIVRLAHRSRIHAAMHASKSLETGRHVRESIAPNAEVGRGGGGGNRPQAAQKSGETDSQARNLIRQAACRIELGQCGMLFMGFRDMGLAKRMLSCVASVRMGVSGSQPACLWVCQPPRLAHAGQPSARSNRRFRVLCLH